jgi:hypothetical protein
MIPKPLEEITEEVLLALISDGAAEGRTIDYKKELPGGSDGDKKEFLADASSFSNTSGGDLVFGMEETQGLPTQLVGLQAADFDLEVRRLESLIASGIDPRIRYSTKLIPCQNGKRCLVIRFDRSWSGPHRVIFKGHDKFYGRNSTGKYPLDVNELRSAFTLSNTVTERIRAFRTERIIALSNNHTPIPFVQNPKIVIHCIPFEAFSGQPQYDVLSYYEDARRLPPMGATGWDRRINLEGVVSFGGRPQSDSYTQLYRNGIIEVVQGRLLGRAVEGQLTIPSIAYEQYIMGYLPTCFQVLTEIGSSLPIVLALTLTNSRGLRMSEGYYPIQEETLVVPEVLVQEFSTPIGTILKPLFDPIWNACGCPASKNFDATGNWIQRR